ncbi:MAG: aminotransferase class I/II-fold pyridoxal phosphate-dependent enzyme [Gammaproteobacteria bacterium]|nr:aminotransferase class I/II-fold pyridoxal phosphate-dependent enzyme [Gammaproteobacteria bacterium]
MYTTATPAAIAEATRASLKIIRSQPQLRERLQQNIRYFRNCCAQTDIKLSDSSTAIQPIIIGDTPDTVSTSNELFTRGVLVSAIRPPTVPEGTARLRITLSAAHSHEQIDKLVSALNRIKQ